MTVVDDALALLDAPVRLSEEGRARAVALLLRMALEDAMAEHWRARWPTMPDAKLRHQLIALPVMWRGDPTVVADLEAHWYRLTQACHAGAHEVVADRDELRGIAGAVGRFGHAVGRGEAMQAGTP